MTDELKNTIIKFYINREGKYGELAAEFKSFVRSTFAYSVDMTCQHCIWKWTERSYQWLYDKGMIDERAE